MAKRPIRNRVTRRLFKIINDADNDPDLLLQYIREFAFEEMEAKMLAVYDHCNRITSDFYGRTQHERVNHVFFNGPPVSEPQPRFSSADIAEWFMIERNHAGLILKELHDLGLMGRKVEITSEGREFWYTVL